MIRAKFKKRTGIKKEIAPMDLADMAFSIWVRVSHANVFGQTTCVTCEDTRPWHEHQCGHYIGRNSKVVRYDRINGHPQCGVCNTSGHADIPKIYRQYMVNRYGQIQVERLESKSKSSTLKLYDWEYIEIARMFYLEAKEIAKGKNIILKSHLIEDRILPLGELKPDSPSPSQ